ncbi:MAG: heavy metal translocating P-type ATPase metal-binding domain-containing protein [Ignavibacteriales bacterium]|nr:heavy metal translocating P-type ATPase metal-binding domain-containing protein [Ignavibacteriales bacterium]
MPEIVDVEEKLICFHCGELCSDRSIAQEEKIFCCEGCKLVYEVLNENNLCTYYDLNTAPGATKKANSSVKRYDYLDDPDISEKLVEFKNDQLFKISFFIPEIHCSSCIWLLENLYKVDSRIIESRVDFPAKKVFIKANSTIKISEIVSILDLIGYEPRLSLDELEKKDTKSFNKALYIKVGIAGFAFGNIMMLSFPEYLSVKDSVESFGLFFQLIMIVLSLPVLFYCSSDYFVSAWKGLKQKFINIDSPLSLGILALWGRSIFEIVTGSGPGYMDSFAGLIFFLLLGKVFQNKTYEYFNFERNYKSYFPISITKKLKSGEEQIIPLSKIAVKDRILIRNNEIIPADSILIDGQANVDYSFVTGESLPQLKSKGEKVFAGGKQIGGLIELEIIKEVSQSYLTRLWNDFIISKNRENRLTKFSNLVSKYFTLAILLLASSAVIIWYESGLYNVISVVTAVLIVACPCALALSAPFALGNTLRLFGRNNFYIKNINVVEDLSHVNSVVFDKTGTLTENQDIGIIFEGIELTDHESALVKSAVKNSLHPLSKIIYRYLSKSTELKVDSFEEQLGSGGRASIGGSSVLFGSRSIVDQQAVSEKGQVDSVWGSKVFISIDSNYKGCFRVKNKYRDGIEEVISETASKKEVYILSGDNNSEMENLSKLIDPNRIRFNQSPSDKMEFIDEMHKLNRKVLMIGDGLNDAAALSKAEVGISLSDDLMNFTPASDALIHGSSLKLLPGFLKQAVSTMNVVKWSFIISSIYNVAGISVALSGNLSPLFAAILMPVSSISVVIFTTLGTFYTAKNTT